MQILIHKLFLKKAVLVFAKKATVDSQEVKMITLFVLFASRSSLLMKSYQDLYLKKVEYHIKTVNRS